MSEVVYSVQPMLERINKIHGTNRRAKVNSKGYVRLIGLAAVLSIVAVVLLEVFR